MAGHFLVGAQRPGKGAGPCLSTHKPHRCADVILPSRFAAWEPCMSLDVLVIGAGLSGLVAAYRAKRAGLSVAVFEQRKRPGGVIGSERRSGALFERGPNSGLDTTPLINAMLDDLGIRAERVDGSKASSRRYVVRGGRLVALPMSPGAFLKTPLFSFGAKLRLFGEPFIGKSPADAEESIAQ